MAEGGLAAHQKGAAAEREPAADGRERVADGAAGATELGPEGPSAGDQTAGLGPGKHILLPTRGKLPYKNVLFYGVGELWDLRYSTIRGFAVQAMKERATADVEQESVAMTMHGVVCGLDEREAFTAQVAGLLDYLTSATSPGGLRRIMIVERDTHRFQRIKTLLQQVLLEAGFTRPRPSSGEPPARLPDAGVRSDLKKHVFVAMPYDDDMEDIYEFGIREPVNEAGYLCERCDRDIFTGDILERIKGRVAMRAWLSPT